MKNRNHLYIVQFGDSSRFKVEYQGTREQLAESPRIREIRDALVSFLRKNVREGNMADTYAAPVIREIDDADRGKYADFPDISSADIGKIGEVLLKEVKNMLYLKQIDMNAPFGDISAG